jgi:hypothetical protein
MADTGLAVSAWATIPDTCCVFGDLSPVGGVLSVSQPTGEQMPTQRATEDASATDRRAVLTERRQEAERLIEMIDEKAPDLLACPSWCGCNEAVGPGDCHTGRDQIVRASRIPNGDGESPTDLLLSLWQDCETPSPVVVVSDYEGVHFELTIPEALRTADALLKVCLEQVQTT